MFVPIQLDTTGRVLDFESGPYSVAVHTIARQSLFLAGHSTYYGMVTEGNWKLSRDFCAAPGDPDALALCAGMYFCQPGPIHIDGSNGVGLVIELRNYRGYPQCGGPLEALGRLRYIDGCSDTLLVCAPVIGEPCLNHLHIPPNTNQTAHTHPTERIGIILRGSGYCETPEGRFELSAGMGWRIAPGQIHSFHTGDGESLDVIAWHPDSDFGPAHENHPMVNRTYVNNVSASELPCIQTRSIELGVKPVEIHVPESTPTDGAL